MQLKQLFELYLHPIVIDHFFFRIFGHAFEHLFFVDRVEIYGGRLRWSLSLFYWGWERNSFIDFLLDRWVFFADYLQKFRCKLMC